MVRLHGRSKIPALVRLRARADGQDYQSYHFVSVNQVLLSYSSATVISGPEVGD